MPTARALRITGYQGEPVPNRFLRQPGDADELAILLPGFGYTCDMPLFYYAENLLTERGADVLRVEYAYNRRRGFDPRTSAGRARLREDATAALRAALSQRPYRRLVLAGKSLGTMAMGEALTGDAVPDEMAVSAVWLTPLLRQPALAEQSARWGGRSLFVIGDADPAYDAASLAAARDATGGGAVVVPGADHGLDVANDPVASVRAVERTVRAMLDFLA